MKFIAVHILANRYCNIFDSEGQDTDTMSVHKKVSANSSAVKTWTFYLEHLGQYCLTNNINIVKKEKSILLTLCWSFHTPVFKDACTARQSHNKELP